MDSSLNVPVYKVAHYPVFLYKNMS